MSMFDYILLARILLTLVTLGYGLATVFADFNKMHATNPQWTPHARFHVVWQICSYVGFFSNRPFGVKRFQTIHHCSVDVAHGLVLLL
jgi:hypothetical protein